MLSHAVNDESAVNSELQIYVHLRYGAGRTMGRERERQAGFIAALFSLACSNA